MFCPLKSVASHCPKNTHTIVEKCRPQAGFGPKRGHRCRGCIQGLVGLSVGGREKGQSPGRMVPESCIPQPPLLPPHPVWCCRSLWMVLKLRHRLRKPPEAFTRYVVHGSSRRLLPASQGPRRVGPVKEVLSLPCPMRAGSAGWGWGADVC